MIRFLSFAVVMFVFVSVAAGQTAQSSPEMMTGRLAVNGKDAGTAYLVGERTILTCAHCLFNPGHGNSEKEFGILFFPGATIDQNGRFVAPRGQYTGVEPMRFEKRWWTLADKTSRSNSPEYEERARADWAVITLDRSPGVGYFDLTTAELSKDELRGARGLGYAALANGRQWDDKVHFGEFKSDDNWFVCNGPVIQYAKGASGGPWFFRKADTGRWTAFATQMYAGAIDSTTWVHRRISWEILATVEKLAGESQKLAAR